MTLNKFLTRCFENDVDVEIKLTKGKLRMKMIKEVRGLVYSNIQLYNQEYCQNVREAVLDSRYEMQLNQLLQSIPTYDTDRAGG
jgi:hypothetical protein